MVIQLLCLFEWIHGAWIQEYCQSIVRFFVCLFLINVCWKTLHDLSPIPASPSFSGMFWKATLTSTLQLKWKAIERERIEWERCLGIRVFISYIHNPPLRKEVSMIPHLVSYLQSFFRGYLSLSSFKQNKHCKLSRKILVFLLGDQLRAVKQF